MAIVDERRFVDDVLGLALGQEPLLATVDVADDPHVIVTGNVAEGWAAATPAIQLRLDDGESIRALAERILTSVLRGDDATIGLTEHAGTHGLAHDEYRVLQAVAAGRSAAEIARDLGVGVRTVERLKQSIVRTLGVRSVTEAVARTLTTTAAEQDETVSRT